MSPDQKRRARQLNLSLAPSFKHKPEWKETTDKDHASPSVKRSKGKADQGSGQ